MIHMFDFIDVSNWDPQLNLDDVPTARGVIVKATEGRGPTYNNSLHSSQVKQARTKNRLVGHYHFTYAGNGSDANTPQQEWDNFWRTIQPSYRKGDLLVLDWEPKEANIPADPVGWASAWVDACIKATGVVPLIYMNMSTSVRYDWGKVQSRCKLWVAGGNADYGTRPTWRTGADLNYPRSSKYDLSKWNVVAWQYTEAGKFDPEVYDLDVFYGEPKDWLMLGGLTAEQAELTLNPPTTPANPTPTYIGLTIEEVEKAIHKEIATLDISKIQASIVTGDQIRAIVREEVAQPIATLDKGIAQTLSEQRETTKVAKETRTLVERLLSAPHGLLTRLADLFDSNTPAPKE